MIASRLKREELLINRRLAACVKLCIRYIAARSLPFIRRRSALSYVDAEGETKGWQQEPRERMINRQDRIDPGYALHVLSTSARSWEKSLPSTNRDPCPSSLASGSSRLEPTPRIRTALNRFHVRRGKTPPGGLSSPRVDRAFSLPISPLYVFSDRRCFSRSFVGPHRTLRRIRSRVACVQKPRLAWESTSKQRREQFASSEIRNECNRNFSIIVEDKKADCSHFFRKVKYLEANFEALKFEY